MKKSELKTGMIVENEINEIGIVMIDCSHGEDLILFDKGGSDSLDIYNDDLSHESNSNFDLVKVRNPKRPRFDPSAISIIWERKEDIPELTMDELTEKLGFNFKIKK
jgi:hypothetical protein